VAAGFPRRRSLTVKDDVFERDPLNLLRCS
jgi:hypothetical protein